MLDLSVPFWADIAIFLGATTVIGFAGTKLAGHADRLADRTGIGEALTGTFVLGFITALPGLTASVTAAIQQNPALAFGNAIGGIGFQTTILALADLAHREANLEHAAASVENMLQTIMLILLMTLVLLGLSGPNLTIAHVHPVTLLLVPSAGLAFLLTWRVRERPMWRPRQTRETISDLPRPESSGQSTALLVGGMISTAVLTLSGGVLVAEAAGNIVDETRLSEAVVGTLFMGVATSVPELVTCLAAVRRRALTLAVADIIGGNFFDVLFVAAADLAFFSGSLYHGRGVGSREVFVLSFTLLLNVLFLAGSLGRQKHGPANIGLESVAMLIVYVGGALTLAFAM
ncbi:MAG: sodium:calcium antiporter [bacterium]